MKKFQKILSAGLILAQVFSSSCIVSANSSDNTKQQYVLIRASEDDSEVTINPNRKQKGSSSTAERAFELFRLGLTSGVILQLLCAKYPGIPLALSKYADDNSESGFKFSEHVKPHANLREIGPLLDAGINPICYFDAVLICEKITGGWQQAAKIAALGFAKDIYVKHKGGTKFEFYYMPGGYGLTSVDACNYLQYLIQKAENLPDDISNSSSDDDNSNPSFVNYKKIFVGQLRDRRELLQSCISYKMWATANGAVTTAANKAASTIKNVFSSLTTSSTTEKPVHDDKTENNYGETKDYPRMIFLPATGLPSSITSYDN
ncbi:MAG: hypothetical protein ACI4PJ_00245 [Acutalibacteraceae bacterium]